MLNCSVIRVVRDAISGLFLSQSSMGQKIVSGARIVIHVKNNNNEKGKTYVVVFFWDFEKEIAKRLNGNGYAFISSPPTSSC
jgi:hypothetical protein